jgi:TPP-dependent pyruvate/acetoin dehydrogenase alpha subunit
MRQTRDPITGFKEKLIGSGLADADELKVIFEQHHFGQSFSHIDALF